jgi:hypothetical protein
MNVRIPIDAKPDELDAHAFVDVRYVFPAGVDETEALLRCSDAYALSEQRRPYQSTATILQVAMSNARPRRADDRVGFDALEALRRRVDALLGDDAA